MKFRTTRKEMLNTCSCQCVPYETLHDLLRFEEPSAYTMSVYGCGADIYVNRDRPMAIVTGYKIFGTMYFTKDELEAWNEKAIEASENANTFSQEREAVEKVLEAFWEEFANRI